ncbi:hypothetical protein GGH99_003396, partial [Coemansia sp. RSA 1285]
MMSTAGHNGRGRRRGRPPGVRAGRSAAMSTHASLKRTMLPQPSESAPPPPPPPPTKSARIAGSVDVADENAHSDLGSAEDLNGSGGSRRLSGAAVASISGTGGRRKRGRPPRLAKTTRSVAGDQENVPSSLRSSDSNTYTLCSAASPAPGSVSGGGSQIGAPSSLLVDPMLFVQNAVSQGHIPNIRDTKKLSDYLCSSITLPDETVLTALPPRLKQSLSSAAVKRDRNAMTVPEPLPSIVKKDHKGT